MSQAHTNQAIYTPTPATLERIDTLPILWPILLTMCWGPATFAHVGPAHNRDTALFRDCAQHILNIVHTKSVQFQCHVPCTLFQRMQHCTSCKSRGQQSKLQGYAPQQHALRHDHLPLSQSQDCCKPPVRSFPKHYCLILVTINLGCQSTTSSCKLYGAAAAASSCCCHCHNSQYQAYRWLCYQSSCHVWQPLPCSAARTILAARLLERKLLLLQLCADPNLNSCLLVSMRAVAGSLCAAVEVA